MSLIADAFTPRWASSPGATLQDVLSERSISSVELAAMIDIPVTTVNELLDGRLHLTADVARSLAEKVGSTAEFWLAREAHYRADLRRAKADEWATDLPVRRMAEMGWIPGSSDWKERLTACLRFFGITDTGEWDKVSQPIIQSSYFRSSPAAAADPDTVVAWLRRGEIVTSDQPAAAWDSGSFRSALPAIRILTREKDPSRFVPRLTDLCMQSGVRFAVVRAPQGCPVSGVARFVDDTKPTIVLSARHLVEDHFWFTFFHEAGHLLLHNPREIYLDDDEQLGQSIKDATEEEANQFAQQMLISESHQIRQSRWLSHRDVVRRAQELRISPGVLVGQLQHEGIINFDTLNGLKRRYKWSGANLERA